MKLASRALLAHGYVRGTKADQRVHMEENPSQPLASLRNGANRSYCRYTVAETPDCGPTDE